MAIRELADTFLTKPEYVSVTPVSSTAEIIEQQIYFVDKENKRSLLYHLIRNENLSNVLVFVRTKHGADNVVKALKKHGVNAEAIHGDLGVIRAEDVVIALSNSGETEELVRLLETIKRLGAKLITISGNDASTLAQASDVALDCRVAEEACPMNLVPTASTTAALALGDALAMTLLVAKGFREEDFASLHPRGALGKRLLRAGQLMHAGDGAPTVTTITPIKDVVREMSRKGLGMTCVVDEGRLVGVITDGDLRRHMNQSANLLDLAAKDVMTRNPVTIGRGILATEVLNLLEQRKITSIVVVDQDQRVEGVVHLHDLWRTEMF
jgi:arabinose-5-phosphate isomerase